jgi:3-hydroxybutyryl-CoA dehydratase
MLRDVVVGEPLPEQRFPVRLESMKVFSVLMRDPSPIHFDPEYVRSLGLGDRPVNQGSITMAYVINAILAWTGDSRRLLQFRCRFLGSLLAGDEACVGGEVVAVDRDQGTVSLSVWLDRDGGERIVEGSALVDLGVAGA